MVFDSFGVLLVAVLLVHFLLSFFVCLDASGVMILDYLLLWALAGGDIDGALPPWTPYCLRRATGAARYDTMPPNIPIVCLTPCVSYVLLVYRRIPNHESCWDELSREQRHIMDRGVCLCCWLSFLLLGMDDGHGSL